MAWYEDHFAKHSSSCKYNDLNTTGYFGWIGWFFQQTLLIIEEKTNYADWELLDWALATVRKQCGVANSGVALIFSVARSLLWHWVCCIKMCGSERVRPARFGRCPGIARRPHRASWPSTTYHNQAQPSLPNKAGSWPHAYNLLEHATLPLTNT